MRVLIISEELTSSLQLQRFLQEQAFAVDRAKDSGNGLYLTRITRYDTIVLHEHQSDNFARELCSKIRSDQSHVPIIGLLSKNDTTRRLALFDAGIDDCLSFPFVLQEVLARIKAILRRGPVLRSEVLTAGGISLDTRSHEVRCGRKRLTLSKKEFGVLELLMRNKGSVVSRMAIFESVWNMDGDPLSNAIESHISTIRKKVGKKRGAIRNVQGRGYLIDDF